jgi:hypothetical protein
MQGRSALSASGCMITPLFDARKFDARGNLRYHDVAGWSSLVARWAHNPKVVGSNPTPATNQISNFREILSVCSEHCSLALATDPHPALHSVASELQVIRAIATSKPRLHSLGSPPTSLRNLDRRREQLRDNGEQLRDNGEQLRDNIDLNALRWLRAWERGRAVYRQQEAGKNPE